MHFETFGLIQIVQYRTHSSFQLHDRQSPILVCARSVLAPCPSQPALPPVWTVQEGFGLKYSVHLCAEVSVPKLFEWLLSQSRIYPRTSNENPNSNRLHSAADRAQ